MTDRYPHLFTAHPPRKTSGVVSVRLKEPDLLRLNGLFTDAREVRSDYLRRLILQHLDTTAPVPLS